MNREARRAARLEDHLEGCWLRIPVLPVGGYDVVIGCHSRKEIRLDIVITAVMRNLQKIDVERLIPAQQAGVCEALENVVTASVTRQEHRASFETRQHNDARQVRYRIVVVPGDERRAPSAVCSPSAVCPKAAAALQLWQC
jgi:hypothetical protein